MAGVSMCMYSKIIEPILSIILNKVYKKYSLNLCILRYGTITYF